MNKGQRAYIRFLPFLINRTEKMEKQQVVVGFGELLWDNLPKGKQIGGAPGNFAFHVNQYGLDGYVVSALGKDAPGTDLWLVAQEHGLKGVVSRVDYPTGSVDVTVDEHGIPQYCIHEGVAWDYIPFTSELETLALKTDAICFGSLAQRNAVSRDTLNRFLNRMPSSSKKIFDINLRQQFYTKEIIKKSLEQCNILKLNEDEIVVLANMLGHSANQRKEFCSMLLQKFALEMIILTCGSTGSYVFTPTEESFMPTPQVKVVDTVGAGDAFTAVFCACLMQGKTLKEAHAMAVK